MQLTIDTALKYSPAVGIPHLTEADLYRPATSIAVGGEALGKLTKEFNGSLEAAAAAYNGGEDNVARWLKRVKNTDPGLFAADVGFSESKDYVFKVMANYRAYSELYTIRLVPAS